MKKLLLVFVAIALVLSLSACTKSYEVAMITDIGGIDDESFNQGTWEGVVDFCEEEGLSYKYYKPLGDNPSDQEYLDAINLAIEGGAKVVVTPGFLFGFAVWQAQTENPDVKFVILDSVPHNASWDDFTTTSNTLPILFNEHESGFLAGYAAVKDGYTHLAFTGGIALDAVVKFGVGYVAGAYYAANEMGIDITLGDAEYTYFGNFEATDTNKATAAALYQNGVEVVFSAAGGAGSSVINAAVEAEKVMIGVDVDQSSKGDVVLTSAMKELAVAVKGALQDYVDGTFVGGSVQTLSAANDGVGLPFANSNFATFTEAQYDAIFDMIVAGTVDVPANHAELVTFMTALDATITDYPAADTVSPPAS